MLDGVQAAALFLDFVDDIVAIFIAVVKAAQNNGIDMPTDEIGTNVEVLFFAARQRLFRTQNVFLFAHKYPPAVFLSDIVVLCQT